MQQTVILTLLDLISLKGIFSFGYVLSCSSPSA